ncbi:hypothetical protein EVAR_35878_1 [Eumeta japonica]|uniref:115 kDa protein in type-1 retrotransposable element R1DM n=1 Tax=Eumeta variegata TaxID=151549 RepID=A0A4C1WSZ4_EUMVA|nr:hypothetical protein EVAR_35878_1 [Eumeta japonica]
MNGEQISLVGEIRLLGLIIDRKLTFILHVAKACKNATNIYKSLARAAKMTWGLGPKVGSSAYERYSTLSSKQSVALKACRAHRTVSLHSTLILSRLLSLDIIMKEASWLYEVKRGKDLGDTFGDRELERPVYFSD